MSSGFRALVVGASGYIGTNLTPWLMEEGWQVRAAARHLAVLEARARKRAEPVEADGGQDVQAAYCERRRPEGGVGGQAAGRVGGAIEAVRRARAAGPASFTGRNPGVRSGNAGGLALTAERARPGAVRREQQAPQRQSDQAIRLGWRSARLRGIDGASLTAEVREYPVDDRRLLDAGDDPQPAAALPAGFIGHIPVPDRFAATFGRTNRQFCRFVDIDGNNTLEAWCLRLRGRCRPLVDTSARLLAAARVLGTIRARLGLAGTNTPSYLVSCAAKLPDSAWLEYGWHEKECCGGEEYRWT